MGVDAVTTTRPVVQIGGFDRGQQHLFTASLHLCGRTIELS